MPLTTRNTRARAKLLRRAETEAEKRLWGNLRNRRLNGYKFVRQVPIGPFIADFLCRDKSLIVEVDGATHSTDEEILSDERRTNFLAAQGYGIHRVQDTDVFTILDDVFEMILMKLENRE